MAKEAAVTVKPVVTLCPPSLTLWAISSVQAPATAPVRLKVARSCVTLMACTFVPTMSALPALLSLAVMLFR